MVSFRKKVLKTLIFGFCLHNGNSKRLYAKAQHHMASTLRPNETHQYHHLQPTMSLVGYLYMDYLIQPHLLLRGYTHSLPITLAACFEYILGSHFAYVPMAAMHAPPLGNQEKFP